MREREVEEKDDEKSFDACKKKEENKKDQKHDSTTRSHLLNNGFSFWISIYLHSGLLSFWVSFLFLCLCFGRSKVVVEFLSA